MRRYFGKAKKRDKYASIRMMEGAYLPIALEGVRRGMGSGHIGKQLQYDSNCHLACGYALIPSGEFVRLYMRWILPYNILDLVDAGYPRKALADRLKRRRELARQASELASKAAPSPSKVRQWLDEFKEARWQT